jgi:hypothetical protein
MPESVKGQSWYPEWREAVDRVVAALAARDSATSGTPEREIADREYEAALAAFRSAAEKAR